MQYNPGDGSGIVDEVLDLTDAGDLTAYKIESITRRANAALQTLEVLLLNADGKWQFDDKNYTTLPIGTGTLVEGQYSYSFNDEFLDIEWIKVQDAGGVWHIINPRDQSQSGQAFETIFAQKGFPIFYDKDGDTIKFGPAPTATAVTLVGGLKICFKRTASLFATTDTNKVAGIASPFHITIARMTALPYCKTYKPERVPALMADIAQDKIDLVKFYSNRAKDERPKITMARVNPR